MSNYTVVSDAIKELNKARVALGKGTISTLEGRPGRINACPIHNGLGIRNKVDGTHVYVRSHKSAKAIAEAWGTEYYNWQKADPYYATGMKDYPWQVELTTELMCFIDLFDDGELADLFVSTGIVKDRFGSVESYKLKRGKQKTTFKVTVDEAVQLVDAMRR